MNLSYNWMSIIYLTFLKTEAVMAIKKLVDAVQSFAVGILIAV